MEILGRARKSPQISENLENASIRFEELKRFMKVLENFGNSSKVFSRCFYDFLNFRKIFGSVGKLRKGSEVISDLFIIFKIFGKSQKSSEVLGNLWKRFPDVIGNVRNGSQELKGLEVAFEKSSNGPQ